MRFQRLIRFQFNYNIALRISELKNPYKLKRNFSISRSYFILNLSRSDNSLFNISFYRFLMELLAFKKTCYLLSRKSIIEFDLLKGDCCTLKVYIPDMLFQLREVISNGGKPRFYNAYSGLKTVGFLVYTHSFFRNRFSLLSLVTRVADYTIYLGKDRFNLVTILIMSFLPNLETRYSFRDYKD